MSKRGKWALGCGLLMSIGVLITLFWPMVFDLPVILAPLPGGHPPDLVGNWQVQGKRYGRLMHLDGNGRGLWWREAWGYPSLAWGTSGDRLVEKHGSTDAWVLHHYRYTLSADGQILTLYDLDNPRVDPVSFRRTP